MVMSVGTRISEEAPPCVCEIVAERGATGLVAMIAALVIIVTKKGVYPHRLILAILAVLPVINFVLFTTLLLMVVRRWP